MPSPPSYPAQPGGVPASGVGRCEAFHIEGPRGRRLFATLRRPVGDPRAAIVHVPAFADEMNKSRRMVAECGRALAALGFAVLQFDLSGCGDSAGNFDQTSWSDWVDDTCTAAGWLTDRWPLPLWLWGHRAGCMLAAQAATRLEATHGFLFWQPAPSGRSVLQQFLRLKVAAAMGDPSSRKVMEQARRELAAGLPVLVAGYRMPSALASGLEQAALATDVPRAARSVWIEVANEAREPSPAVVTAAQAWRDRGHEVAVEAVQGPAFWQSVWMEHAPALIRRSCERLALAAAQL